MALNIGELVAYISVNATRAEAALSQFQSKMRSAGDNASQRFQDVGKSITGVGGEISGVGRDLTMLTGPATGAAVAVGGITAALGWGRLTSIDSAQAQLRGLGYEAEEVERISGQVSTALEGGMMTLGEGTRVAAGALAAGVEEGAELERYIRLVDAAAVGMNASTDETAMIFNRIEGSGKVMRTELDMIEQRMPGFSNALQEHVGESSRDEFMKMVSEGKVGSDEFLTVMEGFAGGMANEFSQSFEGMAANTKAYVGMIGQSLLGGVFEQSKDALAEFIEWISDPAIQESAAEIGSSIGSAFTQVLGVVKSVIGWFLNLDSSWQKVILAALAFAAAIGPVLLVVGKIVSTVGMLVTTFGTIIGWVSKLSVVFTAISKVIGIVTTAFKLLGAAMMANPAGIIIAAIVALVAALIWFFTQTELGQQIIEQVVAGAIIAWEWLRDTAVSVFNAVVDAVVGAWEWIRDKSVEIWDAVINWIRDNWVLVIGILTGPVGAAIALIVKHWDSIKAATAAAWQWVLDKITAIWDGVVGAVSGAVQAVLGWVSRTWDKLVQANNRVWQAVFNAIRGVWDRVRSTVVNAAQNVLNAMRNAWDRVRSTTVNAWNGIRGAVGNGISGVVDFVRGLPGRVLSALGNLGSLLVGSGRSLIDGFTRGIRNAFGRAVDAVKSGVQRVRNFFPFSPAKEGPLSGSGYTSHSGRKMIEDFAGGMSAAESDVVRQAEAITRAAALDVPDVPAAGGPAVSAGASQGQSVAGGVTNNFTIINPVSEPSSETARKASAYIGVTV